MAEQVAHTYPTFCSIFHSLTLSDNASSLSLPRCPRNSCFGISAHSLDESFQRKKVLQGFQLRKSHLNIHPSVSSEGHPQNVAILQYSLNCFEAVPLSSLIVARDVMAVASEGFGER